MDFIELVGYHGTNYQAAQSILSNGFLPSKKEYDWLGEGTYFWQDAPYRAWDWACRWHAQNEPAVISSTIRMRREECMDLLDFIPEGGWAALLKKTHEQLSAIYQSRQQQLPMQNTNRQATPHPLDRLVIDYLINDILTKNGIKISAVRAGFEEGNEIFVGSALYDKTHIQVAIRDSNVIQNSILLRAADF